MDRRTWRVWAWAWLAVALAPGACAAAGSALVDDFRDISRWSVRPADGVELAIHADTGASMRLDFKFVKGGGYALVHRDLDLPLPEDYAFTFRVRGQCTPQDLEFKLIDSTGANVWWCNRRGFEYPEEWTQLTTRSRQIEFAWGPAGGGKIRKVAAIEFAVTAGTGGEGSVWISDVRLREVAKADSSPVRPRAWARSSAPGHPAGFAVDEDTLSFWASVGDSAMLVLDLGAPRECGGLVLDWFDGARPDIYRIDASLDSAVWTQLWLGGGGSRSRDPVYAPESEFRYLRLYGSYWLRRSGIALRNVRIQPPEWAPTRNAFFRDVAAHSPAGNYPRGISGENAAWTLVGRDGGPSALLLGEDGALELQEFGPSIEPFLWLDGRLVTWHDVHAEQYLEEGALPLPSVRWTASGVQLTIEAFAAEQLVDSAYVRSPRGEATRHDAPVLVRYRLKNLGRKARNVSLILAARPFQVNPPPQFLNHPGGTARTKTVSVDRTGIRGDEPGAIWGNLRPSRWGATAFGASDISDWLRQGKLPKSETPRPEPFAAASGAGAFDVRLVPGETRTVTGFVILGRGNWDGSQVPLVKDIERNFDSTYTRHRAAAVARWRERTRRVRIDLPGAQGREVANTIAAQLAYMRISRDGPGLQPGMRSYRRTWIRDGAMMSTALLRLGQDEVVKEFLRWFAEYTYADGKVPCCVDIRGSDPVPENDSHGEFIHLAAEYYRYTGDLATLQAVWPRVRAAAAYIDTLRAQRRTAEFRKPGMEPYFGLLPESISHEGYSAKPMHSYWDDFFALRGFKDAAYLADVLGHPEDMRRFAADRDEFQQDLAASIAATMKAKNIDFIPGCAELGDFDATSTTIAMDPAGAETILPAGALERTFMKYDEFFMKRRQGATWDAFTPYEMRTLGSYVRLGWWDKLPGMLDFFLEHRTPRGWRQWPEVVWHDARAPHFIGDLPHTWVGSDFVRSVLDMFAYVRESDSALVVGAGVPAAWTAAPGVRVQGLRTPRGKLDLSMLRGARGVTVKLSGGVRIPPGGIAVNAPVSGAALPPLVDGKPVTLNAGGEIVVRRLPATVHFRHR